MSEPVDEHGEWDALAVGWALSALDPEDEERFADHLPGCARCTATVRESLYTVADLAYALPDEAPPPALKARLMAAVGADVGAAAPAELPGETPQEPPEAVEPEPVAEGEEEWPLGTPHPGSPGYGVDWFAKPGRTPDPTGIDEPTVVDLHRPSFRPLPPLATDDPDEQWAESEIELPPAREEVPESVPQAGYRGGELTDRTAGPRRAERSELESEQVSAPGLEDMAESERVPGPRLEDTADSEHMAGPRGADQADLPEPRDGKAAERGADVVPLATRRRRLARRITAGVGIAAVLALIAGLLVSNLRLRDDQDDLRQVVAQRDAAIKQLTANGPARVAALTTNGKPAANRQATLVVRGNQVEVIIEGLGATSGNETYWLWTLRCDTPQPEDLKPIRGFTVAQSDFSVRDIGSDPGVATAPCFAISSEEGTATPKTPRQVVAVGQPG